MNYSVFGTCLFFQVGELTRKIMNILSRLFLILLVAVCEMTTISDTTYAQNPTPIATFEREEVGGGSFGRNSMASGDINGDGINDFVTVDGDYDGVAFRSGRVYVFFGRAFSGAIPAEMADVKIDGIHQLHGFTSVRTGNLDGDKFADLIASSIDFYDSARGRLTGRVFVFYGNRIRDGGQWKSTDADFFIYADSLSRDLGISTLVDFDGDSLDDLVVYSIARDQFGGENRVSIFYTKNVQDLDSACVLDADFSFAGPYETSSYLICSKCSENLRLSDLDGDESSDLVVTYHIQTTGFQPDTIGVLYGINGGHFGSRSFGDIDVKFSAGNDAGGYGQSIIPFVVDYDADNTGNVLLRNSAYHFDPDYNNMYGRVYMFKQPLENGNTLEDATTKIRGTIAGILSGSFGLQMDFADVDGDGILEMAVADYGYGLAGAQFLFRGREEWPDSLSDMDANVKIFGNANYSGLSNGVMLGDIMGTGKAQWLLAYDQNGSRIDGFVDLYPSSVLTGIEEPRSAARSLVLHPNYPNPFNPTTTISYELPSAGHVELSVYNVLGQEVRRLVNSNVPSGYHKVIWDGKNDQGRNVASGIYIVMLQFGNDVKTRKIMLLK